MSVLRRAYVEVEPDVSGFDTSLKEKLRRADPGGKAGKQVGGQLNRALKRFDLDPINVKADVKSALAGIAVAENKLRELSGDSATVEVKIQTEKALGQLKAFRRQLGDAGKDAGPEAATGFAAGFNARVGPLLAKAPISGPILGAVGILGAAIAPTLGAAIAGGVVGGAGLGGVVGGMIVAARDERVGAAVENLGLRLNGRLERAAGGFVEPTLVGIREIEGSLNRIDVESIFRDSGRFIPVLTRGFTSAIDDLGDGFETLVSKSGPAVAAISRSVASVGATLGSSFKLLAQDSDEGASAIDDLTGAMNRFIQVSVGIVHGLAVIKGGLDGLDSGIDSARSGIEDFFTKMSGGRAEFDITADGMGVAEARAKALADQNAALSQKQQDAAAAARAAGGEIRKAAEKAAEAKTAHEALTVVVSLSQQAANAHSRAVLGQVGAMKDLNTAMRAQVDPLFGVITAQGTLKTAQDKATEATRKHGRSSDEAREANRKLAEAALDLQGKTAALAVGFNGKLTPAMRATFKAAGLTKAQINDVEGQLVTAKKAADKFDGKYMANVGITGDKSVLNRLANLAAYQDALKKGSSSIAAIRKSLSADNADFLKFDTGGYTGPGPKMKPAGVVHADEFVIRKESRQKIENANPGLLAEMNATGQVRGYARGGMVGWPFPVTASKTRIPSIAEVAAKVAPAFGAWPSSPGAQRGDSGVWRKVLQLIKSGPRSGSFGNAYRPGDPKWHGSGRAVDWMGFNQDPLASFLAAKRPLELIHRTRNRDYAYTRGRNKGSFNNSLMNAHRNHIHIAMDDGGVRMLQPGMNVIPNFTGRPEPIAGPAAMAAAAGGGVDFGALIAEVRALRTAIDRNGDTVGRHVRRGIGGVDASLGAAADLYARTS